VDAPEPTISLTSSVVSVLFLCKSSAITPVTYGADMEVPALL
jgi:hypothetical protein